MLRIGVSSGAFYPGVPSELAPMQAAEFEFADVELMLQTTGEYNARFLADVHRGATGSGINIASYHLFQPLHPFLSDYQRRTDEAFALFRRAIESARRNDVATVVWHGATRKEGNAAASWERFIGATSLLVDICAEAGVILAIENVSWCIISSVRDVLRLDKELEVMPNGEAVGFTFDSFQAFEAGANPFMLLAAMGKRIVNVHLSDGTSAKSGHRHLLPGTGELPWPALIKAISGSGYRGTMMIEAPLDSRDEADRVRTFLEPLITDSGTTDAPCSESLPPGIVEGIALFNSGHYYECHEAIEHEWHAERRPIRRLYQGILQIGVGLHHTRSGNHAGAILLLTDGIEKVSEFLPECQGVPTSKLILDAQICLDQVRELGPDRIGDFNWAIVPVIDLTY